jgi:predicted chitinase
MQAIADRFTAPKPEVDSKRYQVENVSLKLNGKTTKLKHFILGYEGDFTINLNEFSEENIKDNTQDKLLFGGAHASKKELLALHGTKIDVKTVYDYLSPKKGKLTGKQLKEIFPGTSQTRCDEVAKLINKYADKFEITMPLRMAHFLGQIGWESNQLKAMGEKSGEGTCYKKTSTGWSIWFALTWKELPYDHLGCDDAPKNNSQKVKKKNSWKKIEDVPNKFICDAGELSQNQAGKNLFCYVYRCEGGNGDENSCDGFTYRGHGIMQLTWKKQYEQFNDWLKSEGFESDYKKVLSNPDKAFEDKELDVLSGLWFWKENGCNKAADKLSVNCSDTEYKKFTTLINKGADKYEERKKLFKSAYNQLK